MFYFVTGALCIGKMQKKIGRDRQCGFRVMRVDRQWV